MSWERVTIAVVGITLSVGVVGCGDSVSEEDLTQALEQQRQQDRVDELEDKLRKQKDDSDSSSSSGSSGSSSAPSTSACGSGVTVNSATSCEFAANVAQGYYDSGKQGSFEAFSPVTGETYTMSCSAGSPHTCTGGNGASVTFP